VEDQSSPEKPPTFTLPDWGTEGAPTLPPEVADDDTSGVRVVAGAGGSPAGAPPARPSPAGLVVGAGEAVIDSEGLAAASQQAALEAIDDARSQAASLGASSVDSLRITLTTRQGTVAALAYGTAVGAFDR
jgi:hypothetical protein